MEIYDLNLKKEEGATEEKKQSENIDEDENKIDEVPKEEGVQGVPFSMTTDV